MRVKFSNWNLISLKYGAIIFAIITIRNIARNWRFFYYNFFPKRIVRVMIPYFDLRRAEPEIFGIITDVFLQCHMLYRVFRSKKKSPDVTRFWKKDRVVTLSETFVSIRAGCPFRKIQNINGFAYDCFKFLLFVINQEFHFISFYDIC